MMYSYIKALKKEKEIKILVTVGVGSDWKRAGKSPRGLGK